MDKVGKRETILDALCSVSASITPLSSMVHSHHAMIRKNALALEIARDFIFVHLAFVIT